MPGLQVNDRLRCVELACTPGSVFELVHRFLPPTDADQVLAVEAFFCSIRQIPERVSDPAVAMAKMAWWVQELNGMRQVGSQHPVLRALLDSGALDALEDSTWESYIAAQLELTHDGPCETVADFESHLSETGGHEALIWVGLDDAHPAAGAIRRMGMASRLLDLSLALAVTGGGSRRLPREWHSNANGEGGGGGHEVLCGTLRRLAALALEHLEVSDTDLRGLDWAGTATAGGRFLAIRAGVERRRLARMRSRPERLLRQRGSGGAATDALVAWRLARRYLGEIT